MTVGAPLSGVTVVDFSLYVPGPYCTMTLADLGADVIKIEPVTGDPVCEFMPGLYDVLNGGKRVLPIDLKQSSGLDVCRTLLKQADVVVEGFRPGVADRLGIGYDAVTALRSEVVYCSISGFGQDGPRSADMGHDVTYTATAGGFAESLAFGEPPRPGPFAAADLGGALFAATSINAALAARPRTAVHLDVALTESALALAMVGWAGPMSGTPLTAVDNAALAPGYGIFRCADGIWVALAAVEDSSWLELCTAVGRADLAEPPYDGHRERMRHRVALAGELATALAAIPSNSLIGECISRNLPASTVSTIDDMLADQQLRHRDVIRLQQRGFSVGHPVKHNSFRPHRRRAPVGALHELSALSGMSTASVDELIRNGVVGHRPPRHELRRQP